MSWIFLVLLYGIFKGFREICKKKAMTTNSVIEVLVMYTFISFAFACPQIVNAGGLEPKFYFFIALKALIIFIAWICGFYSLKKLPVSVYGILDLSRVLFSAFFGITFLHEKLTILQLLGYIIVCSGILMLKFQEKSKQNETISETPQLANQTKSTTAFFIALSFISCFLNAVSGFMDKLLMKDISSSQLQFWYMLFLALYYLIFILIKKIKISKSAVKNPWIWLLAALLIAGDKAYFIANANPQSQITTMTLIKQSCVIITILGGKIFFKEKHIGYRLICAFVILSGILLSII